MEHRIIPLWTGEVPFIEPGPDAFRPAMTEYAVPGSRGALVICPGGAYINKADHEGGPIAELVNRAGISAYVLDYRVHPCHPLAPLNDALRAIRLARSFGYRKVGILGFSAGGHLCCSAATLFDQARLDPEDPVDRLSSRPDAFVPCYPVVSMGEWTHALSRSSLLTDLSNDPEWRERFSTEKHISRATPPAFLWSTAEDELVPVQNTLMLARSLADCGVNFELHIFPHGVHGLGLAEEVPVTRDWGGMCCRWLLDQGFGPAD